MCEKNENLCEFVVMYLLHNDYYTFVDYELHISQNGPYNQLSLRIFMKIGTINIPTQYPVGNILMLSQFACME